MLSEGSQHVETTEDHARLLHMTNMSINIATLPIQTLQELHQGISDEHCVREKRSMLIIEEVKTNNQLIFVKKVQTLQVRNEMMQSDQRPLPKCAASSLTSKFQPRWPLRRKFTS